MEKLANKIANKISDELKFDDEKRKVINYGIYGLIQLVVFIFSTLILGLILGIAIEALIMSFTASLLRKYSGGAHVSNIEICTLISVMVATIFPLLIKYFLLSFMSIYILGFLVIIVFLLSFFFVYKLAPVDSPNKPIKTEKKKKRMRKGSFLSLILFLGVSILLLIFGTDYKIFYGFCLSILFAVSWQILTLTKLGAGLFNSVDTLIYKMNR